MKRLEILQIFFFRFGKKWTIVIKTIKISLLKLKLIYVKFVFVKFFGKWIILWMIRTWNSYKISIKLIIIIRKC